MSYKIAVLSDTHGLLRKEVKERLQGCDRILHAGDIHKPAVLEELNRLAPVCAVRGNADKEWAEAIPEIQVIDDVGIRILMIHNRKQIDRPLEPYNLIVYGHSHKYEEKHIDGQVWLNPGSCGPRRFKLPVTMAMLYIKADGTFRIKRIEIEIQNVKASAGASVDLHDQTDTEFSALEAQKYLPVIMRDIDKGVSAEKIAKRYHLSKELAEQICRLYLTHPGVDADGIMAKMGL